MTFTIVRQDITTMGVDAIVNAANTELAMGGGVCGAIFRAAGAEQLQAACRGLAPIKTGEAVITPGFGLKARYVIHAAGPVYRPAEAAESARLLRAAYVNSLKVAVENDCSSVAFPLISSGIYGYPKDEALRVAVSVIEEFLAEHDMDVTLVVFDRSAFALSRDLLGPVEAYIDEHYVATQLTGQTELLDVEMIALADHAVPERRAAKHRRRDGRPDLATMPRSAPTGASAPLSEVIANLDEPFSQALLRLIDAKGYTDVEVYKRANLDRKLFSKIRSNPGYMPGKRTVIALALALRLSLAETEKLLERAGFALSPAVKLDVIVEYFISVGNYNIFEINQVLFAYDQPLLGVG